MSIDIKHFKTGKYRIDIYDVQTFTEGSAVNTNDYDFVYFDESEYQFPSVIGIKTFLDSLQIKSVVIGAIGGGTCIHDKSQIIENDKIIICCSDSVFCLSIPDLNLIWKTKADQATCFEIFKHQDEYIIHGELEISKLDSNGNILWQNSGADIFTTLNGIDVFEVTDSYIRTTDWDNRTYKFDFDGKLID